MRINPALIFLIALASCKRSPSADPVVPVNPTNPVTPSNPVDPANENTIGFFLDDWEPKSFAAPAQQDAAMPTGNATVNITVDASTVITRIPKSIFGQNANSWMSQMVTEAPLMNHLTQLRPGLIRFPGGSISDLYFWNGAQNEKPADY